MRKTFILACLIVLTLCAGICFAGDKKSKTPNKYQVLEITPFEVDASVNHIPPDFQDKLMERLIKDLQKTKRFATVNRPAQGAAQNAAQSAPPIEATEPTKERSAPAGLAPDAGQVVGAGPVLVLSGKIIEFDPGSRTKRYFSGYGAGASIVVAHVKFSDAKDSTIIFERDVQGKMTRGAFGGEASGAATELSKEIARMVKKQTF